MQLGTPSFTHILQVFSSLIPFLVPHPEINMVPLSMQIVLMESDIYRGWLT